LPPKSTPESSNGDVSGNCGDLLGGDLLGGALPAALAEGSDLPSALAKGSDLTLALAASSALRISASRSISSVSRLSWLPFLFLLSDFCKSSRISLSVPDLGDSLPICTSSESTPTILTSLSLSMPTSRGPLSRWAPDLRRWLEGLDF